MEGKEIITIEGLAKGDKLDPVQQAFIEHDGPQCGFCTSGQIMSGKALLMKNSNPTEAEARRALSGQPLPVRQVTHNREVAAVSRRQQGELREVVMAQAQKEFSIVGKRTTRIDAYENSDGPSPIYRRHPASRHALCARAPEPASARENPQH